MIKRGAPPPLSRGGLWYHTLLNIILLQKDCTLPWQHVKTTGHTRQLDKNLKIFTHVDVKSPVFWCAFLLSFVLLFSASSWCFFLSLE